MRYPLFVFVLLTAALGWLAATDCRAQTQRLETREVFVFPGDMAFIYKAGDLKFRNRKAVLDETPEALYGTYWLRPAGDFSVTKTEFGIDTLYRPKEARNFYEVLLANVGGQAVVTYQLDKEVEDVRGKILPFTQGADLVMIRQSSGNTIFLERNQVKQVSIEGEARLTYQEPYTGPATIIEIDKDLKVAPLEMYYYRKGLSWQPSYALKMVNDSTVIFNMKANLTNEGEAFRDARIKLVLANSNLRYGNENLDPMAKELLQLLGNQQMRKPLGVPDSVWEKQKPATDLFFFQAQRVSMRSGSRAEVPVLKDTLSAGISVRIRIPLQIDSTHLAALLPIGKPYFAERALNVKNTTGGPLPPGSVFILDADNRPLGQDELSGLKPGETSNLAFGLATNLSATITERIESRTAKAKREGNITYDYVEVAGIMTVENTGKEPTQLEIQMIVPGEVKRSTQATTQSIGFGPKNTPLHQITWQLEAQTERPATYNYRYGYFVPR